MRKKWKEILEDFKVKGYSYLIIGIESSVSKINGDMGWNLYYQELKEKKWRDLAEFLKEKFDPSVSLESTLDSHALNKDEGYNLYYKAVKDEMKIVFPKFDRLDLVSLRFVCI